MKNLVLGSLIALGAAQLAGCVIETDNGETATISATWSFHNESTNTDSGCPAGYDTVALYNETVDGDYCDPTTPADGKTCIELFDCANLSGVSAPLRPTAYKTWLAVTTHNNSSHWAQSTEAIVDVTLSDATFSAQILNDGGYFDFAWNLVAASNNAPVSCAQAGLTNSPAGIYIEAFLASSSTADYTDIYNCDEGAAYTSGHIAGTYDLLIDARTNTSTPIGTAPTVHSTLGTNNDIKNIGTVTIPITSL